MDGLGYSYIISAEDAEGLFLARSTSGKFLQSYSVFPLGVFWNFCTDFHDALTFDALELDAFQVLLDGLEDHSLSFHPVSEFLSEVSE